MIYILTFLAIFILIAVFIFILLISGIVTNLFCRVPYCPTPNDIITKIIKELDIKPCQTVYDLGCGDGRFLFEVEKLGAKTIGFELSLPSFLKSRFTILKKRLKTKIYFKNFFKINLADADLVFCFLNSLVMSDIENLLKNTLKKGTTVVIYGSPLPNITPYKSIDGKIWPNKKISKINFYKI